MVELPKPCVWFTHADANQKDDRYRVVFENGGFLPVGAPLITITPKESATVLATLASDKARSIIATSARALTFLRAALESNSEQLEFYCSLPCYTLAGSSAETARKIGLNLQTGIPQLALNSGELLEQLLNESIPQPLLFPCSSIRHDTLPDGLRAHGIEVIELPLYETTSESPLKLEEIERLWYEKPPQVVCFFSPSAVRTATDQLKHLAWNQVHRVAIGSRTAQYMEKVDFTASALAQAPHPDAVIEAVQSILL